MALVPRTSLSTPIYTGYGSNPWNPGIRYQGLRGSCGCDPISGCDCQSGLGHGAGMKQYNISLDQLIANAAAWLGGFAQSQLPPSAAVPPQYGSTGAAATTFMQWVPWIIGGILVYKLVSK